MSIHLLFLLCCIADTAVLFKMPTKLQDKYRKLREKINAVLNRKGENTLVLNIDDYEYPKANETLRKIHRERWQEYYECLKRTYAQLGPEKMLHPVATVALEGTSLILDCQICISPAEINNIDIVDWFYSNSYDERTPGKLLDYTENTLVSPENYRLTIYNVQRSHAGRYWCKMSDTLSVTYYVHVDKYEDLSIVRPDEAPEAPHAATEQILGRYDLRIYTTWTRWSACSACDVVGQKMRYGYCSISSIEGSTSSYRVNRYSENANDTDENFRKIRSSHKPRSNKNLRATIKNVLELFKNKLPCRSEYTPEVIQRIPEVDKRKNEMMLRYCKHSCPKNVVFEVRDKNGNVIESANNSAGIYSVIQGIPEAPPPVSRITLYRRHKQKLVLRCPGNLNTDTPITWKIGNKLLVPSLIEKQTSGRIRVNPLMQIIFKKLRFADTNIYSCWQNNELAGTIKLNVSGEIEVQLNQHILVIGAIAIVTVFLMVFWKAFKGRTRYTIH